VSDDLATTARRSRRALLAAAAAGAAGLAASKLGAPETVTANTGDSLTVGGTAGGYMETTTLQVSTGPLSWSLMNEAALYVLVDGAGGGGAIHGKVTAIGGGAGVHGEAGGSSQGVAGESVTGPGVYGTSGIGPGVQGVSGSTDPMIGAVQANNDSGTALYAQGGLFGAQCVAPTGTPGSVGIFAGADIGGKFTTNTGRAVVAFLGTEPVYNAANANTAVLGAVTNKAHHGLIAQGGVSFPDRSGKIAIAKGKSSASRSVPGVTAANFAIAQLATSQSGRWVRATVCATGKITVYLNTTTSAATSITYLILG
jgi:hypothetical protein